MADSGGHWKDLAELAKLSQSTLVPGVIEEDIKRENLVQRVPVAQAANSGKSIKWLRESTTTEDAAAEIDVGEQLSWSEDIEYTEQETELKRIYLQRKLDQFVKDIYGNVNDYEAQVLLEMKKGVMRKLGDRFIYGDITYGSSKQFDGLHALNALQTGTDLDIDEGDGALSLANFRKVIDAMKYGVDEIWIPFPVARNFDAAYQEVGLTALATNQTMGRMTVGWNEAGKRQTYWDGIPMIRTDYLVAEQDDVGDGSNLRAKDTAGDLAYSIFFVKFGNVLAREPGLSLGFGGTSDMEFFRLDYFDKLEDYDARGMRLINYSAPLLGSKLCLGRIWDVGDAAITA